MRRVVCVTILLFVAVATPTAAKEGARARLLTSLPLHARAGARIAVAWTVTVRGPNGEPVPFRANPMFVRLIGKAAATTAFARQFGPPYRARIRVPRGGIRGIKLGLMGYSTKGPAPAFFPIANSPFRVSAGP
jgi:hypothetical protein